MKSALSVLVLLALTCTVFADINSDWASYTARFNKNFGDFHEIQLRKTIYFLNLLELDRNNLLARQGKAPYYKNIQNHMDRSYTEIEDLLREQFLEGFKPVAHYITDPEWVKYKNDFHKSYPINYDHLRYTIFHKNLSFIKQHNKDFKDGKVTFDIYINKHTDETVQERQG